MPGDSLFDEGVAARYDAEHPGDAAEVEAAVALLAELAGSGPALEFAIGTGRLALPLARTGVAVEGIELSRAMVARLRAKPGGASIPVAIGDMTTVRIEGRFALVYLAFNTINNLTTQAAQVACFRNAAAHLEPGGCFVVEVGVPPLQHLPPGETRLAFARSDAHWGIDEIDVVSQNFVSHHVFLRDGGVERRALPMRYVWPAELDLMAELAGLRPKARWADWSRAPFTATSRSHVSVWDKPDG
ncbi:class I SAM-dependent DNA methyltransferase [Pontivivens ytuae]|uniref:Class I SAM-dependent methyltransferase n=1 Tax=Pontivivens ytuae TaxID=2789856 RepID=A0A7S9QD58_9RHOB|nr:class I SAM-dependent methyltransferase [Pontivivens ytuae]QPH53796.1 class I SAM-dependent methyltransferase [Pontivivens ytuae]